MMFFGGGMLIFWLLLLAGIVAAMGGLRSFTSGVHQASADSPTQPIPKESPEELLSRRYARGEISREEYLETQVTLKSQPTGSS